MTDNEGTPSNEQVVDPIVLRNYDKLTGSEMREAVNRNGSVAVKKEPDATYNLIYVQAFADNDTGEVKAVGTPTSIDDHTKDGATEITLAWRSDHTSLRTKIFDPVLGNPQGNLLEANLSPKALRHLKDSIDFYNQKADTRAEIERAGFKPEDLELLANAARNRSRH
jgi:hypothetical protein